VQSLAHALDTVWWSTMRAGAASKGAVDSFTTGLGKEVGKDGIPVVGIRPGMIATDILEPIGGMTLMQATAPTIPLGRVGQAGADRRHGGGY